MNTTTTLEPPSSRPSQILMLSAPTLSELETATTNLATCIRQHPELDLADVAYTLQVKNGAWEHRRMLVCSDLKIAAQALDQRNPRRVYTASCAGYTPSIVWLFPGQGSQYVGMAQGLYQHEPVFRMQVDRCAQILQPLLGIDIHTMLYPSRDEEELVREQLNQTWLIQPILFVIEYALAQLWLAWGIRPYAMIGHSLGEYVAACVAKVFSLEDALRLVVARGQLMQQAGPGAMLAVFLSESELQPLLGPHLSLAAVNSPIQCVVSGPNNEIHALHNRLNTQGLESRLMDVDVAAHSAMMRPVAENIRQLVATFSFKYPRIPYISNLTGTWVKNTEAVDPAYWEQHMCQTVRFADGLAEIFQLQYPLTDRRNEENAASLPKAPDVGDSSGILPNMSRGFAPGKEMLLFEVGPGQALTALAMQHPASTNKQVILPSIRHPHEKTTDLEFFLQTLGKLWLAGVEIDNTNFFVGQDCHRLSFCA